MLTMSFDYLLWNMLLRDNNNSLDLLSNVYEALRFVIGVIFLYLYEGLLIYDVQYLGMVIGLFEIFSDSNCDGGSGVLKTGYGLPPIQRFFI